jgi:hypothetical protein
MSIFSRFFQKKSSENAWPNHSTWAALKNNQTLQTSDGPVFLWTVPCGDLTLPSGRLVACDPFVSLAPTGIPFVETPKGNFPVVVTLADLSEQQDRSHIREAYASILFSAAPESYRKAIPLGKDGEKRPESRGDEFIGFGVDAGTACFVDESLIATCMPDPRTWSEAAFDNDSDDCWFKRMDDPAHIREGIANIPLPLGKRGENLILFHSGWGDGVYPLIGSFNSAHQLVAAHIDFFVVK